MDEKEKQMEEAEEGADQGCMLTESLLEYAERNLQTDLEGGDMVWIRVANETVETVKKKLKVSLPKSEMIKGSSVHF